VVLRLIALMNIYRREFVYSVHDTCVSAEEGREVYEDVRVRDSGQPTNSWERL
jgi:hypothetical protein